MGSGKGKNRRTKTSTPSHTLPGHIVERKSSRSLTYNPSKWKEFLNNSGLNGVCPYGYYLGKTSQTYTTTEHNKVLNELFTDAAAIGAFSIPSPYETKDLTIRTFGNHKKSSTGR